MVLNSCNRFDDIVYIFYCNGQYNVSMTTNPIVILPATRLTGPIMPIDVIMMLDR